MSDSLTNGQIAILRAFNEFGSMTDLALSVYVHHVAEESMSSSGIRTRRSELSRKGLLSDVGTRKLKSGRMAVVHGLSEEGRRVAESLATNVGEYI